MVFPSGICSSPSSEHTNKGWMLFFPTLLWTSCVVSALQFPLCWFPSCGRRFCCRPALVTQHSWGRGAAQPQELLHHNLRCPMAKGHPELIPCMSLMGSGCCSFQAVRSSGGLSKLPVKGLTPGWFSPGRLADKAVKEYATYRSGLLFWALVDLIYNMFKVRRALQLLCTAPL